nr:EOG090X07S9 [Cyclestheria hislopi]
MEQNIPIDIQNSKLLDWLISRRHCNRSWSERIQAIREKINSAIQDMPEHPGIIKLLAGSHINYFHCLQIVEILKETEADSRNLFGWYGSQRMKDWQEIIKLYEKDNVGLAEAAQMLIRNVTYEIPATKKMISKYEQIQHECERKEIECAKLGQDFHDKYVAYCHQIGIEGKNVKQELVKLLDCLPSLYKDIAQQSKKIGKSVNYYQSFINQVVFSGSKEATYLSVLQYVIEHGNTTVYEWRYGEPPLRIEEAPLVIDADESKTESNDDIIDFGADTIDFGGDTIDFGNDINLDTGDIDWGRVDVINDEPVLVDELGSLDDAGIVVEEAGVEGGVARDHEALSLLDYAKTRSAVMDDLCELEAFLKMRLVEMQSGSNQCSLNFTLQQSQSDTDVSVEQLTSMLTNVVDVISVMNTVKLQHLALIRESPRYVDRLTASLQQRLKLVDKMTANGKLAAEKRRGAAAEQSRLQPQLQLLIEKTKELQSNMERHISKKYNNRPVHIIGGISAV